MLSIHLDNVSVAVHTPSESMTWLCVIRKLGLDSEKTNVNGSGISLGHPVGATGAIIVVKLMEQLERRDQQRGLVTMCVGGGQGVSRIFERISYFGFVGRDVPSGSVGN